MVIILTSHDKLVGGLDRIEACEKAFFCDFLSMQKQSSNAYASILLYPFVYTISSVSARTAEERFKASTQFLVFALVAMAKIV